MWILSPGHTYIHIRTGCLHEINVFPEAVGAITKAELPESTMSRSLTYQYVFNHMYVCMCICMYVYMYMNTLKRSCPSRLCLEA
jgi:hypothetical protein